MPETTQMMRSAIYEIIQNANAAEKFLEEEILFPLSCTGQVVTHDL